MKTRLIFNKILPVLFILSIFSFKANASNYYWIGGTGNWDDLSHWATTSGGSVLYTQIPTALDDVYFDANSFSATGQIVHLNPLTVFVHSMNWTGVTNNPTMAASGVTLLKVYGSLVFVAGMNMNYTGLIDFESTTPGQIITTAGKVLGPIEFTGIGGEWTLQDDLRSNSSLQLNAGTLNTNNKRVNIAGFYSTQSGPTTRALNMGASIFTLDVGNPYNAPNWQINGSAMMTVNSGTSVINMTAGHFSGGGFTYYDLNFTNTGSNWEGFAGNADFHDVFFASNGNVGPSNYHNVTITGDGELSGGNFNDLSLTAGHSYIFIAGSTTTINGTLSANGNCGALIDFHSKIVGTQANISHAAGTVNISYAVIKDVHTTGGATFTASNSSDLGNNNGWNFTSSGPQNLYWIGDGGNWSDVNHWSHTSGGAASGCLPTPMDNVFFDANSFSSASQTVTIDPLIAYCRNMVWTGVSNTPSITGMSTKTLKIYGSLTFSPNMNMGFQGQVNFEATTAGQTITMAGQSLNSQVNINGIGGEWTLQDEYSGGTILFDAGTFTSNDKTVNWGAIQTTSSAWPKTLNMGASVFNVSIWMLIGGYITINCGTSVINLSSTSFFGQNHTYYDLNALSICNISGSNSFHDAVFAERASMWGNNFHSAIFHGDGELQGNNSFGELTFSAGHTYSIRGISISDVFNANGNCGAYIDIHSLTVGTQAYISKTSGTVNSSYLILKDIAAVGGATFNAGNSTDLGNNSGWNIAPATGHDLYWVGDGGNWSDGNHWSFTSGGVPSGCSPTPLDNVFFDANSFSTTGQVVIMNNLTAYCRNMTWTGVTNNPAFNDAPGFLQLKVYGSLTFSPNMNVYFDGGVYFEAITPGQTITMAGKPLPGVVFNGIGGSWTFQDAFTTPGYIMLSNGTLNTNDQIVNARRGFVSMSNTARTLNLGASVFNITGSFSTSSAPWDIENDANMIINSGTSVINLPCARFVGGTNKIYYDVNFTNTPAGAGNWGSLSGSGCQFHNVVFKTPLGYVSNYTSNNFTFNSLTFEKDGTIGSSNTFNELNFTAGYTYVLDNNSTQIINDRWRIQGSCTSYIVLQTDNQGQFASVVKPSGDVLGYNIHIKDIHCSGGANFIAYNSVDLGGNTGWNFSILPPLNNPNAIIGPTQICPATSAVVSYHIPPVTGAISYEWTVPPGAVIVSGQGDTILVVDYSAASSGNLVVQSFNGCNYGTISSTLVIVVETPPAPVVTLAADTIGPVCPGTAVTFTATALNTGAGAVNYNFLINGVSAQNSNSNIFTTTTLSNNDEVSCAVAIAATSCFAAASGVSDTIAIIVNTDPAPDPHVTITANPAGQLCAGIPVTFTATVTGSGSSSINYDFKINGISAQSSSLNTFTIPALSNNDAITCTITLSATACFAAATAVSNTIIASVNTDPAPDPHASITSSVSGQICLNTAVTFTATVTGAGSGSVNYNFKVNGVSVQSSSSNVFTTTALLNNDQVSCEVTVSATACFAAATSIANTIIISVNTDPGPDPHVSIVSSVDGQICLNTAVMFTATVTGSGSGNVNYNFEVNGISVQNSSSNVFTTTALLNNDQVSCEVTASATACFAAVTAVSNIIPMSVNTDTAPDPHVSVTASPDGQLCAGMPITFTATTTGAGNNNIDYDFKVNGNSVQHGNSNIFTTSTLMNNDAITCSISVSGGTCFSSSNAMSGVIVLDGGGCDDCILQIPIAITPNGDRINDKWVISNQNCFRQIDVSVFNRYGSLVYQKNNYQNDWEGRYKNQTLPDATYYYLIKAIKRDGREQVFKGNVTILR